MLVSYILLNSWCKFIDLQTIFSILTFCRSSSPCLVTLSCQCGVCVDLSLIFMNVSVSKLHHSFISPLLIEAVFDFDATWRYLKLQKGEVRES